MSSAALSTWKVRIVNYGIFLLFVVEFGDFIVRKIWVIVAPLMHH